MRTKTIIIHIAMLFLVGCKKDPFSAKIVRDCTGTYLRDNGKDYKICNVEKVNGIDDEQRISATYRKIETCQPLITDSVVCEMYHPHEGWVEVLELIDD